MKYIIFFLFAFQICSICQQGENIDKQIINSKEIFDSGIVNLSDIFLLAEKWNSYTIDGSNWYANANNLSPYQRQNFIVMLDGQRIDMNFFDQQNLNMLPITIDQIDYVELINSPQIYAGEFTERGLIHFHTKNPVKKLSAHFNYTTGDKTGDPGPYKYTQYTSPNVDHINYLLSTTVFYGSSNWNLSGHFNRDENFLTDPELKKRISNLSVDYNKAVLNSFSLKLSVNALTGNHNFFVGVSDRKDFFFFKPYGNEIPVSQVIHHVGLNGNVQPTSNLTLNYSLKLSGTNLEKLENKQNLDFDFKLNNLSAKIDGIYSAKSFQMILGLDFEKYSIETKQQIEGNELIFRKFYGNMNFDISKSFSQSFGIYLLRNDKNWSLKSVINNYWKLNAFHSLNTSFTYSQHLLNEDLNYWTWFEKGYTFSNENRTVYNLNGIFNKSTLYTADLNYVYKFDSTLSIKAGGNFRHFSNYYLEKQIFQFSENTSSFNSAVEISPNNSLKVISGQVGIEVKMSSNIKQKLFYYYQKDFWGNDDFRNAWKAFPTHSLVWIFDYKPVESFSISTRLKYVSPTKWLEYQYYPAQSSTSNSFITKSRINYDISIQKWFGGKIIWTNIIFRNIFNKPENYYPIGVNMNLRWYVQVRFYFDSLPE
ncbi:MAG: hypothetical protein NTX22_18430 [Ignavibacteriales bacterium]|nr:hypothetical protein [Ignavibacteriales bacterium]